MAFAFVMVPALALAQDQTPPPTPPQPAPQTSAPETGGAWRHMGDQAQQAPQQNPEPMERPDANGQQPAGPQRNAPPAYGLPPEVTLKAGTYVNVRINGLLSSDKNHIGDTFTATLFQPIIADGVVIAPRGTVVYGRVADAEKAHNGKDSRLGLEITSVTLADNSQAPVQSRLIAQHGTMYPRGGDPTVVGTPAPGAAPAQSTPPASVMMTHGHATEIYPGNILTFDITTAVPVSTANGSQAFRFAGPEDYQGGVNMTTTTAEQPRPARPAYVYGPGYPGYNPYYYPYYPYWGPTFGVGIGFGGGWGRRWR